jgi:hypothetical protein
MKVHKSAVTTALREQGAHDRAQQADCVLPRHVDTERDVGLLRRFGVDVSAVTATTPEAP